MTLRTQLQIMRSIIRAQRRLIHALMVGAEFRKFERQIDDLEGELETRKEFDRPRCSTGPRAHIE